MLSARKVGSAIFDLTGHIIPAFDPKKREFDPIARALWVIAEEPDTGESNDPVGEMRAWINDYLDKNAVLKGDEIDSAICDGQPFERNGVFHINRDALRQYLDTTLGVRMTPNELNYSLGTTCDLVSRKESGRRPSGERVQKRYWQASIDWLSGDSGDGQTGGFS